MVSCPDSVCIIFSLLLPSGGDPCDPKRSSLLALKSGDFWLIDSFRIVVAASLDDRDRNGPGDEARIELDDPAMDELDSENSISTPPPGLEGILDLAPAPAPGPTAIDGRRLLCTGQLLQCLVPPGCCCCCEGDDRPKCCRNWFKCASDPAELGPYKFSESDGSTELGAYSELRVAVLPGALLLCASWRKKSLLVLLLYKL